MQINTSAPTPTGGSPVLAGTLTPRRLLDRVEQVVSALLFVVFVMRLWPHELAERTLGVLLLLVSESLVVVFLILRRSTEQISVRFGDWIMAAAGTALPLLVIPRGTPMLLPAGPLLLLAGILLSTSAKIGLSRSFGLVAANRGVKKEGPYRLVRHPMYAGYIISHAGFLLTAPVLWNAAIYAVVWTLLVARVIAEERVLSQDPAFREYAARVRYRLLPGVF